MFEVNGLRREFIKSTGVILAGLGTSGTALAKGNEKPPEISVLAEDESTGLFKVKNKDKVSVYQVNEAQDGQVIKMPVGNVTNVMSISAQGTDAVIIRRSGPETTNVTTQDVSKQGWEVVERSKGIDEEISSCLVDHDYTHQYKGFTFELNQVADVVGKQTLSETISVLIGYYLASGPIGVALSFLTGVIAGSILSLFSGRNYTVGVKDGYIDSVGGYTPQILSVVANSYDAYPYSTTNVGFIPNFHIGGEYQLGMGDVNDNPWVL